MNRLRSAVRLVFYLPPLWIALGAITLALAVNGSDPLADIARFAVQRLF